MSGRAGIAGTCVEELARRLTLLEVATRELENARRGAAWLRGGGTTAAEAVHASEPRKTFVPLIAASIFCFVTCLSAVVLYM